jgi:hypothetical protein
MLRILWLSILFLSYFTDKEEVLVIHEKRIRVEGNTSLGKFECSYNVETLKDTLIFINNKSTGLFTFEIPVNEFSCGNFLLNKDFKKTLKSKEFPLAYVKVTNLKSKRGLYTCDLHLEIAGKKLLYREFLLDNRENQLLGNLVLDFETLELVPPSKFGGLIQVEETLFLSLALIYT